MLVNRQYHSVFTTSTIKYYNYKFSCKLRKSRFELLFKKPQKRGRKLLPPLDPPLHVSNATLVRVETAPYIYSIVLACVRYLPRLVMSAVFFKWYFSQRWHTWHPFLLLSCCRVWRWSHSACRVRPLPPCLRTAPATAACAGSAKDSKGRRRKLYTNN